MVTILLDHKMPFKPNNAAHILQYGCNAGAGAYSLIPTPGIPFRTISKTHTTSYPKPYHFVPKSQQFRNHILHTYNI